MALDINTLRTDDRDGGGIATSETVCSEGQQGFRQVSNELMKMLNFAWSQCVVMKDYEKASSRWLMAERMLRQMGIPENIIDEYTDRLTALYTQPVDPLVKVDIKSPGNQVMGRQNNFYSEDYQNDNNHKE